MSGKSFARAATSAFMATRQGSPRLHCEKPTRNFPWLRRPQPSVPAAAIRTAVTTRRRQRRSAPPALERYRAQDDDALENELKVRIDVVQTHRVVDDPDDQGSDERSADGADASREAR